MSASNDCLCFLKVQVKGGRFLHPGFWRLHLTGQWGRCVGRWTVGFQEWDCFICPCYTRVGWPLRMWPCTSPGRNGVFLMRFRYTCTWMSCWRTLHLCACWVRPAHSPPSSELGSAFLLFPRDSSVLVTTGQWTLFSIYFFIWFLLPWVLVVAGGIFVVARRFFPWGMQSSNFGVFRLQSSRAYLPFTVGASPQTRNSTHVPCMQDGFWTTGPPGESPLLSC